jgi:DNA ligase (NAD+)
MISIDSLRKLTDECAAASYAYYVADDPIMSDLAYDILYDKLQKAEEEAGVVLSNSPTQCVQGEATNSFAKVKHIRPMLSASKTKEMADVTVFAGDHPVQVSWKLDGLTAVATYKKGQLVQVATRGDGEIGEDVTANAKRLMNLPLQLERPVDLVIRGEVLCPVEAFNT